MDILEGSDIPRLEVPASEDPMQMSPDMDRHSFADEDIDIDLDLESETFHEEEDDAMDGQNGFLTEDQQYNDDMVDEDVDTGKVTDQTSLVDEDLDDADNTSAEGTVGEVPAIVERENPQISVSSSGSTEQFVANIYRAPSSDQSHLPGRVSSYDALERPEEEQLETPFTDSTHLIKGDWQVDTQGPQALIEDLTAEQEDETENENTAYDEDNLDELDDDAGVRLDNRETLTAEGQTTATHAPATGVAGKGVSTQSLGEAGRPREPHAIEEFPISSSSLHPVNVIYQGSEMSLFPSTDEASEQVQTYFLQNQAVAAESVSSLLQQCRLVLADSINEQDELEIRIADLGLSIDESAAQSLEITLEQILEIYLHLSHNDGLESPDPLYIELVTMGRCSYRLEYLFSAVAEDKGLSDIEFPYNSGDVDDGIVSYEEGETDHEQKTNGDLSDALEGGETTHSEEGNSFPVTNADPDLSTHDPLKPAETIRGEAGESTELENPPTEVTNPSQEGGLDANSNDDEAKRAGTFGSGTGHNGPANYLKEESGGEAAADEDSIIDYSDEESFHGETSTGSSTLQGDPVDTPSSVVKTQLSQPVNLDANSFQITGHAAHDEVDVDTNQDHSEEVGSHEEQEAAAQDNGLHAFNSGAAGPTSTSLIDSGDLSSGEGGLTGLDEIQDEDIYDKEEIQDLFQPLEDDVRDQNGAIKYQMQDDENADELGVDATGYYAISTPRRTAGHDSGHPSTESHSTIGAPNSTENAIRPDNKAIDTTEKYTNGSISIVPKRQADATASALSGPVLPEDEITFDEYDDDHIDPNPKPASPRSLKRARDGLEGEADTDQSSSDIKRARSS